MQYIYCKYVCMQYIYCKYVCMQYIYCKYVCMQYIYCKYVCMQYIYCKYVCMQYMYCKYVCMQYMYCKYVCMQYMYCKYVCTYAVHILYVRMYAVHVHLNVICKAKGMGLHNYRISRSISHSYTTNSYTSFRGTTYIYTECITMEIEMRTGIISRLGQSWNMFSRLAVQPWLCR